MEVVSCAMRRDLLVRRLSALTAGVMVSSAQPWITNYCAIVCFRMMVSPEVPRSRASQLSLPWPEPLFAGP